MNPEFRQTTSSSSTELRNVRSLEDNQLQKEDTSFSALGNDHQRYLFQTQKKRIAMINESMDNDGRKDALRNQLQQQLEKARKEIHNPLYQVYLDYELGSLALDNFPAVWNDKIIPTRNITFSLNCLKKAIEKIEDMYPPEKQRLKSTCAKKLFVDCQYNLYLWKIYLTIHKIPKQTAKLLKQKITKILPENPETEKLAALHKFVNFIENPDTETLWKLVEEKNTYATFILGANILRDGTGGSKDVNNDLIEARRQLMVPRANTLYDFREKVGLCWTLTRTSASVRKAL